MPDRRKHRGPHPEDETLFAAEHWPRLRRATLELSWLLGRGYTPHSALKLVGDRHALNARQRSAVSRAACSDASLEKRRAGEVALDAAGELWLDGFNVVLSVEVALSGGFLFIGRDGCVRDLASVHGSYRLVEETLPSIESISQTLHAHDVHPCRWLLDAPVSNSGRLAARLRETAESRDLDWSVEVVRNPDELLVQGAATVASADGWVLDNARRWCNLARSILQSRIPDAKIVDLRTTEGADALGLD
jgi:hypothetical protein